MAPIARRPRPALPVNGSDSESDHESDNDQEDDSQSDHDQEDNPVFKQRKVRDYNLEADKLGIDREYYRMEMCTYIGERALVPKQPTTNVFKTVVKQPAFETPIYGLPTENSFSAYVPLSGLIPASIPHCTSFTTKRGQVWSVVPSCHMMLTPHSVQCVPCPSPRLITRPAPTVGQYQQPAFPTACVYPSWVKNKYNQGWTLSPKLVVYDRAPYLNFPVLDIQKIPNVYISRDSRVRPVIHRCDVAKLVFASGRYDAAGNE